MKFVLLTLFVALVVAERQALTFTGNITHPDDGDFKFRYSSLTHAIDNVHWASLSIDAKWNPSGASADINTIFGMAYGGNTFFPPWAWLRYYGISVDFVPGSGTHVEGEGGGIATIFLRLKEFTPKQKLVKDNVLSTPWTMEPAVQVDGELKSIKMTSTIQTTCEVSVTWIVSDIVGVVSLGNAWVSPKNLEGVVEIKNYPYADIVNHLELYVGVATVSEEFQGHAIVNENDRVYFTMNDIAIVDNKEIDVKVSKYVETDASFGLGVWTGTMVKVWLSWMFGAEYDAYIVSVPFPPGAADIIYDPALGQGEDILYGAGGVVFPSVLVLLLTSILALIR